MPVDVEGGSAGTAYGSIDELPTGRSGGKTCVRPWSLVEAPEASLDDVVRSFRAIEADETDGPLVLPSFGEAVVAWTAKRTSAVHAFVTSTLTTALSWLSVDDDNDDEGNDDEEGTTLTTATSARRAAATTANPSSPTTTNNTNNSNNSNNSNADADTDSPTPRFSTSVYRFVMVVGLVAIVAVGYAGQRVLLGGNVDGGSEASTSDAASSAYAEVAALYDDKVVFSVSTEDIGELRPIHSLEDVQVAAAKVTELTATGIPITLAIAHNAPPLNDGLFAEVTNEYSGMGTKMLPYPFLKDAVLMEPYRESTVTLKGFTPGCNLEYTLTGVTDDSIILSQQIKKSEDGVFTVKPTKTGQYVLHAEQTCDDDVDGQQKKQMTQTVWVKYVRRELMTLTDEDREEFLDAFRTLWDVTTKDGMTKFGKLYKSVAYLSTVHNDAGANSVCDEFHAGTGFLNNHMFLGMYLEQSLRLINPKVSMHYMDYSKYFSARDFDNHLFNPMDGGNWTEIMSDKWFGHNDPESGVIVDSRWAYTKTPYLTTEFLTQEMIQEKATFFPAEERAWLLKTGPHIMSPYGLLRAPWNYNPSPYLTRYNNVNRLSHEGVPEKVLKPYMGSNCEDMKIFFAGYAVDQPMYVYLEATEDNVHGYVHFTIGGSGGDRAAEIDQILREKYGLSNTHLFYIAEASHKFVKSYLAGMTYNYENPVICTGDPWVGGKLVTSASPGEDGGPKCKCNQYYMESEEKLNTLIDLYFNHFMPADDTILNLDFETRKEIMDLACTRMSYEGDLAGSGAAMDPLFWVVHGAVDRLFQRVSFSGVLTDKVYHTSKRSVGCSGHETTGTKRWLKGLFLEDSSIDLSMLTNQQLAEILDPSTDAFRDLQNSVYADSLYPWCEGFEEWLATKTDEDSGDAAGSDAAVEVPAKKGGIMNSVLDSITVFRSSLFGRR